MKLFFTSLFFVLMAQLTFAQIVINELDCDTPSIDTLEFLELKSDTPNFSLNGYVVVFFNGSTNGADSSYLTFDLDGFTTDVNGLLLIGSSSVSPIPQLIIPENLIQNGADAVGVYFGSDTDFPDGTLATTTNLIHALAYDTADADDTVLMGLLGLTEQINEGSSGNTNSIQRKNDGTYEVKAPTPRALNDGTGVVLNGVTISVNATQYNEGDNFDITFTTEQNVASDLVINFSLNKGTFTNADFSGNTSVTILNGQNSVTSTITLIDDTDDEGDEVLEINMASLPAEYLALNNLIEIRVVDNDFVVAAWGTPLSPTFGLVSSTEPVNYYDPIDGLSDVALEQAIQDIIAEEGVVRAQTYADVVDILKEADQNPANSNQVWLVYTEQGRAKLDYQTTSNSIGKWNREHTFPRSRGGFNSIEDDDIPDGINVFWNTNADSLRHGNSDAHALRAADGPENSSRGNQYYGDYIGPVGTAGSFKGDVARSVLYMQLRYNGLSVVENPTVVGEMGYLSTLLDWHRNDPPDDYEMNRNNIIYNWQFNRNPLIDKPDLVEYIWGNMIGQVWSNSLSVTDEYLANIKFYPNPATDKLIVKGINQNTEIQIYSIQGQKLFSKTYDVDVIINIDFSSGVYIVKLFSDNLVKTEKMIVK
ncbi:MAG: endonuclease [Flavobacteriaceae bacterium]